LQRRKEEEEKQKKEIESKVEVVEEKTMESDTNRKARDWKAQQWGDKFRGDEYNPNISKKGNKNNVQVTYEPPSGSNPNALTANKLNIGSRELYHIADALTNDMKFDMVDNEAYARGFALYMNKKQKDAPAWLSNYIEHTVIPNESTQDRIFDDYRKWAAEQRNIKPPAYTTKQDEKEEEEYYRNKHAKEGMNNARQELVRPTEMPNVNGQNREQSQAMEVVELRRIAELQRQEIAKLNQRFAQKDNTQQLKEYGVSNSRKCRFGAGCKNRARCLFEHPVKGEKKPNRSAEAVNASNQQLPVGEVDNSIVRVFGRKQSTGDGNAICVATAMVGKLWFWKHAVVDNDVEEVRFVGEKYVSQWIRVGDLRLLELSNIKGVGDDLLSYHPPTQDSNIPKSLERNKTKLQDGQQLWLASFNLTNMAKGVKIASGNLDTHTQNLATYDFTTIPGDCGSAVMVGGTTKVIGLHLYGATSGNSCMIITNEVATLMQSNLPQWQPLKF
jgi:hypothetical protein